MIRKLLRWLLGECKAGGCTKLALDSGYCREHAKWLRENTTLL